MLFKAQGFEDYLQEINPELKAITRNVHNLELGKKDPVKLKAKGVKMDQIKKELAEARIKFHMEPDELIALVKNPSFHARGTQSQNRNGGGQPIRLVISIAKKYQPRSILPRFDSGRKHGADESGRKV